VGTVATVELIARHAKRRQNFFLKCLTMRIMGWRNFSLDFARRKHSGMSIDEIWGLVVGKCTSRFNVGG